MNFKSFSILSRLKYLIKHEASISIILAFLKFQLTKPFFNTFRSKDKKLNKEIIKDKLVTDDFFSINAFDWKKNLNQYKKKNDVSYLEIGSFEGISAYFIHKFFDSKIIHCVDTWLGSDEHGDDTNFKNVESNFDKNTKKIKNLNKYKTTSDNFFDNNQSYFDIIYIDGLHKYYQVKKDLNNALKFIKKDGTIICDDYFWNINGDKLDKPINAINEIIKGNNLKIVAVTVNQIFIKKN